MKVGITTRLSVRTNSVRCITDQLTLIATTKRSKSKKTEPKKRTEHVLLQKVAEEVQALTPSSNAIEYLRSSLMNALDRKVK
jgi:hypothetical protein